jgi:hypothetical protein
MKRIALGYPRADTGFSLRDGDDRISAHAQRQRVRCCLEVPRSGDGRPAPEVWSDAAMAVYNVPSHFRQMT